METYETIENKPDVLSELTRYNRGEQVFMSQDAIDALDLITSEPEGDFTKVVMGSLNINNVVIPGNYTRRPQGYNAVLEDYDHPEAVYLVRVSS